MSLLVIHVFLGRPSIPWMVNGPYLPVVRTPVVRTPVVRTPGVRTPQSVMYPPTIFLPTELSPSHLLSGHTLQLSSLVRRFMKLQRGVQAQLSRTPMREGAGLQFVVSRGKEG